MKRVAEKVRERWDEEFILSKHGILLKNISVKDLEFKYLRIMESRKSESWLKRMRSAMRVLNLDGVMLNTKPERSRTRFQKIVGKEYDLHSIRHTFASELSRVGASKLEIKALMGHSSDSVTEDYVHHNFNRLKSLINKL